MRLTDEEARDSVGIDPVKRVFTECIQAQPCLMELRANREFYCAGHHALFLPALVKGSATAPGTFGFLLGDAANAIHFWPGRGLNSGLSSVISLARCLAATWRGRPLRDADFLRHEAVMAMLQYRHKSRAWRQMVTADADGRVLAIKDQIARGIAEGELATCDRQAAIEGLMGRLSLIRSRLEPRIGGLPDDATLRAHLESLPRQTLHTLLVSDAWDTGNVGGEEVDVEWLLEAASAPPVSEKRDRLLALEYAGDASRDGGSQDPTCCDEEVGQPLPGASRVERISLAEVHQGQEQVELPEAPGPGQHADDRHCKGSCVVTRSFRTRGHPRESGSQPVSTPRVPKPPPRLSRAPMPWPQVI
jgi:hypothetical protein